MKIIICHKINIISKEQDIITILSDGNAILKIAKMTSNVSNRSLKIIKNNK